MKRQCQHLGCQSEGYFGIEKVTCGPHRLRCTICERQAVLFTTAGQLCQAHTAQARAIEMHGAYPSHAAIESTIRAG